MDEDGTERLPRRPARRGRAARPEVGDGRGERVSSAEYARRYEREMRSYVERYTPAPGAVGPGHLRLSAGHWAWVDDGVRAAARWCRYADQHGGLKTLAPDGTWRPWEPPLDR